MLIAPAVKEVMNYHPDELELFIREWLISLNKKYYKVDRVAGTGDMGRDVVGFISNQRYDGVWDNYQCKQYKDGLAPNEIAVEVAKVVYYSWRGEYVAPRASFFVAPKGISRECSKYLGLPKNLKEYVVKNWVNTCSKRITDREPIPLSGDFSDYVDGFDFGIFDAYQIDHILDDHRKSAFWAERFKGALPEPAPGVVPSSLIPKESIYVKRLIEVYAETAGAHISTPADLDCDEEIKDDFIQQRERFFCAEAFANSYRDETKPGTVEDFQEQIKDSILPVIKSAHPDGLARLNAALGQAAITTPSNLLSNAAKPRVKQGVCHQLANNDEKIRWVRDKK